jgi:hypothetical protein
MTFADLLSEVAAQAGDTSAAFRVQARRWLNFTRAYIADRAEWRTALNADVTITTAAATTDGLYSLTGYERVSGDYLYDETNEYPILPESLSALQAHDPDKSVTGNPEWWADAGVDSDDNRQIYLWPIPDGAYVIRYAGYEVLTDIGEDDEQLSVDPFFGELTPWSPCLMAGLRYHMDLDNNEDAVQIAMQLKVFEGHIKRRKAKNSAAPHIGLRLANVRSRRRQSGLI